MNEMVLKSVLGIALLVGCLGCASTPHLSGLRGQTAPVARFTSLDGSYHSLGEFRGKAVVVAFWAEWCMFSKPVIGKLNELAGQIPDNQAVFLAVSIDPAASFDKLRYRIEDQKLHSLQHAFSGNELFDETYQLLRAQELPHIYVIDRDGIVVEEGHSADVAVTGLKRVRGAG